MENLDWLIGLLVSLAFALTGVGLIVGKALLSRRKEKERELEASKAKKDAHQAKPKLSPEIPYLILIMATVFLASMAMFYVPYLHSFETSYIRWLDAFLMSVHNSIRLFVVDADYGMVFDTIKGVEQTLRGIYYVWAAILYLAAPLTTFTVLATFFRSFFALLRLRFTFGLDQYIFSELNEYSITLAEDIRAKHKKDIIVFCDVYEDRSSEDISEYLERAKKIKAICLKKDIAHVPFSGKGHHNFFMIGDNESENVKQYADLYSVWKKDENAALYLSSKSKEGDLIFSSHKKDGKAKTIRFSEATTLVYHYLYRQGAELFQKAKANYEAKESKQEGDIPLTFLIVGLGFYGAAFLKGLVWFGQMWGYRLKIVCVDADKNAKTRFAGECPELLDEVHNGVVTAGDAFYDIEIHPGIDKDSEEFNQIVYAAEDLTAAFVCLGVDNDNVETAVKLRTLSSRKGKDPLIKAVVFADESKLMEGAINHKGQSYNIDFLGRLDDLYCVDVLIDSPVEVAGRDVNRGYNKYVENAESLEDKKKNLEIDNSFYAYEFNYRSSCASAIHAKLCFDLGLETSRKEVLTEQETLEVAYLEHCRWNAWMRSEGYVYGATRNDLGKVHPLLTVFDKLSEYQIGKDLLSHDALKKGKK